MKKIIILTLALVATLGLRAQNIEESVATVGNLTVPASTLSINKDVKLVQNAMEQYLKDLKLKTQKQEGWLMAVNAFVETISISPINLYTRVEEQGKKKDRHTVVTAAAISTDLTIDQNTLRSNVKNWLSSFVDYLARYEAQQQMAVEQGNLKKAEKEQRAAVAASNAIDKSIASDQEKIADKQKKIKKLQQEIKDLEKEIADLEKNIEKSGKKKEDAEKKVEQANQGVNDAQGEVDRYRQMAQ